MRRQILSRSLLTVAAASSILAVTGGYASADAGAQGGGAESRHSADDHSAEAGSAEADSASDGRAYGAEADSSAHGSPGVLSGNSVNIPVQAPVNVCGNSVDVVGLLNSVSGNSCGNGETPATPVVPGPRHAKPPAPQVRTPAAPATAPVVLAETGTSRGAVGAASGAGAALLLGGAMLYRRSTRTARIRRTYS